MEYYNLLLKKIEKIEKPEKYGPVLGAVVATGLAAYVVKRVLSSPKKTKFDKGLEPIPTPKGAIPYFGHIPYLGEMPAHKITEWHQELGPIIRVKMGVQDWIFVSEPQTAHELFATQGAVTSGRPYITFGNGISGEGDRGIVFTDYNKKWKNARTAISNILSPKSVIGFDGVLQREANNCINHLLEQTDLHGGVNPLMFMRCSSLNIILATGFGLTGVTSPDDPKFKEIIAVIELGLHYTGVVADFSSYFPILSFLDVIFRKEAKMKNFLDNMSDPLYYKLIQAARDSKQDSLIKKLDLIKEELEIDEQNIKVIMSEVVTAGGDTVSITSCWTFAILVHHPEVQKKLADEVDAFIIKHQRTPTFEDRAEFPYYNAMQKEAMRFRPPVYFGVPRKTSSDVAYKNYIIPEGATLVTNIHTLHNDPNTYPEPEKFIPERFMNDNRSMYTSGNGNINDRDHFVFGWGRRICPGIYLAETELFNTFTRVMAQTRIEPLIGSSGEKIYPDLYKFVDAGSVLMPGPFKVRFVRREDRVVIA